MRGDRHHIGIGTLHFTHLGGETGVGQQPLALACDLEAGLGGVVLHDVVRCVAVREILLDATPHGLEVLARRGDPFEHRLVHRRFAGHIAERPLGDGGQAALGRDVGVNRELQARIAGIAHLLLQDAEQRLGHVAAGRPVDDNGILLRRDTAQRVDAFFGAAPVIEILDDHAGLDAIAHGDATRLVDLLGSGLHRGLAVEPEDAHHAALGTDAIDFDGALLRVNGRRGQRERAEHGAGKGGQSKHHGFVS